jgi:hypothetical protein
MARAEQNVEEAGLPEFAVGVTVRVDAVRLGT